MAFSSKPSSPPSLPSSALEFRGVLSKMAGTKESIRKAKEWLFARPAEVGSLAATLEEHVVSAATREDFSTVLFAIYLLNDVFFNSTNDEPFRSGCLPHLRAIVAAASKDEAIRDKAKRVVELWGSKLVFPKDHIDDLRRAANGEIIIIGGEKAKDHDDQDDDDDDDDDTGKKKKDDENDDTGKKKDDDDEARKAAAKAAAEAATKLMTSSFASPSGSAAPPPPLMGGGKLAALQTLVPKPPQPPTFVPSATLPLQPLVGFASGVAQAAPLCDLAAIPVGIMAGLVKVALNDGHQPWKPLDLGTMPTLMPPAVEPGRLEARVNEFYRVLEKHRLKRRAVANDLAPDEPPSGDGRVDDGGAANDEPPRSRRRFAPNPWAAPGPPPSLKNDTTTTATVGDRPIGDDNLGKQMLRGMGWQEGRGLGAHGRGRAEPVNDAGQTDKIGIGSRDAPPDPNDPFAQYRAQRSSGYKARWNS